jgi:peptidoglycan/LPS O-acetylase OafA/YrhL
MAKDRNYLAIDILKHLLAICVVIQHTHSSARYSTGTNARLEQLGFLVQGAVFTFFLISGTGVRLDVE